MLTPLSYTDVRVVHAAVQTNQVVVKLELVYGTLGELIHVCIVLSSNWAVLICCSHAQNYLILYLVS